MSIVRLLFFCVIVIIGTSAFLQIMNFKQGMALSEQSPILSGPSSLNDLKKEIEDIIGEKACVGPAECKIIPFGSKPCGGPAGYLPYSVRETDTVLLEKKVEEFNEAHDEYNRRRGLSSDCMFESEPQVGCMDGKCAIFSN